MMIKKVHLLLLFVLFSLTLCTVPQHLIATSLPANVVSDKADLLLDKIYAVHATSTLPASDYLRAGWSPTMFNSTEKALLPQLRKTLHFALGELTRPVEGIIDWEGCSYAVVTSLRSLLPQLINLNCYDTFIFGDFKLGPETFLIVPADMAHRIRSAATIVTYDPQTQTLREAVNALILFKRGWHIEMDSEDIEDELHAAYLNGRNVNTPEFFKPLKEGRPWLAVGLRFDPLEGEHYRLMGIELSILSLMNQMFFHSPQEPVDWNELQSFHLKEIIETVTHDFECWSQAISDFDWPIESQRAYEHLKIELKKWICLMHEELRLREVYGKTLMFAPDDFLLECATRLNHPEKLRNFIDNNKKHLSNYP
jgi:hypothetical protein